jgi:TRAP-type mannitol/chloroaromatic compound transport system substrate-binding protein
MQDLADRIKVASGGRLEIVLNAHGSIVPGAKEFDGVDLGTLDYGNVAPSYLVDKWPAANPFAYMIGGLTGIEYAFWMNVGGGNELVNKMIAGKNIKMLTNTLVTTPEVFLQSKKELKSVADIKGLKIRSTGDDGEILTKMGASVIFLPGGEVYQALQRGVIDALQLSTPAVDWAFALHEIAKFEYLSPVRQPNDPTWVFVSPKKLAELPDDLKKIVEEIHYSQGYRWYARLTQLDLQALEKQKAYGVKVAPIPKDIEDEMIRLAKTLYDEKSAKDALYGEVVKSQRAFMDQYRAAWPRL